MEHSILINIVLVLILIGLFILIIIVNKLIKITSELSGIKEKLEAMNLHRQKEKLSFKAIIKGQIFYPVNNKEKAMKNYIEPIEEKLDASASSSEDIVQVNSVPPKDPGPKFEADVTGTLYSTEA